MLKNTLTLPILAQVPLVKGMYDATSPDSQVAIGFTIA